MAQAELDTALWDLFAQEKHVPPRSLLGGHLESVPVGVSLGKRNAEREFLEAVECALCEGFTRVKCKVSPGFLIDVLHCVRRAHPDLLLSVDANGSFTEDDFDELRAYDALKLVMFEQPFHTKDILLSAELQRAINTSICFDESIEDVYDLKLASALKACRIVNIKPARVGGLTSSLAIRDMCHELGLKTWVGGLLETGIGRAANLAFASTMDQAFPHDISPCETFCAEELITKPIPLIAGARLAVPSNTPGLGITVNREALERYSTAHVSVVA